VRLPNRYEVEFAIIAGVMIVSFGIAIVTL